MSEQWESVEQYVKEAEVRWAQALRMMRDGGPDCD